MWSTRACALCVLLAACGQSAAPPVEKPAPAAPPAEVELAASKLAQPKPGERVRQPLLDSHCGESASPTAFYYHGGNPVAQRALGDGCRPLYLVECADDGTCSENREQEPGMWCCGDPTPTTAHADRGSR